MRYRAENQLSIFEFHDTSWSYVSFDNGDLTVSVKHLNISKGSEYNPHTKDMEIEQAFITFKYIHNFTYDPGRTWKKDVNGISQPITPLIIYEHKDAEHRFIEELKDINNIFYFGQDSGHYELNASGIEPFFTVTFDCENIIIEWDNYRRPAWYELHKHYKRDIILDTPHGEQQYTIDIHCDDEAAESEFLTAQNYPTVTACITYNGEKIYGRGRAYTWEDTFADLQKQLPKDMKIKCCITCRHGNFCPVGNERNELFCTEDVTITQKSDLYFYTEDETEREKRRKQSTSICSGYEPQTSEYFTYNDFLHYLN